jgi:ABC-type branched-subunit amino acid transport system substrate-binding protein
MAVAELNSQGLSIGGKKVKFELVAEDDAADPKQGTAAAQKLCDAKVNGVVGHLNSGTTIPASKVYNQCGLPMISPSATNPELTQLGYKNVFRLLANDNELGAGLARHAQQVLKLKKVAIIDDRTAYGKGVAEVFARTAKELGMEVVSQQYTNDKAVDFMSILTAIKNKKPDGPRPTCLVATASARTSSSSWPVVRARWATWCVRWAALRSTSFPRARPGARSTKPCFPSSTRSIRPTPTTRPWCWWTP